MKRKDIHLIVPRSWNECSTQQLEQLSGLAVERNIAEQMGYDTELGEREYRMRCFLVLAGLEGNCRTEWVDGEPVFWFRLRRSTWWKRLFCRRIDVPIMAWQMRQWVDRHLKWLDDPYGRLNAPYIEVDVRRRNFFGFRSFLLPKLRLHCLANRMTDCTYRQYINLENILKQYWMVQELANEMSDKYKKSCERLTVVPPPLKQQLDNLEQLRRMFVAAMLSPASHIVKEDHNGTMVKCDRISYLFTEEQISDHKGLFTTSQVERMFPVLLQFYLSVQRYFSSLYPNLYVERNTDESLKRKMPDFIRLEIESMSTIMKYQGFADYRTIYDSDAVHILRVLDNMAQQARDMKRK